MHVVGRLAGQVGGAPLAAGEVGHELGRVRGVAEDRRGGEVPEERHVGEHAPALAEHEHRVERIQPGAALGFVDQQAGPAGLAGGGPQVGKRVLVAVERLAGGCDGLEARERAAGRLTQEHLLV